MKLTGFNLLTKKGHPKDSLRESRNSNVKILERKRTPRLKSLLPL
jgi:hypothetical protein